jgi:hypothetical protein
VTTSSSKYRSIGDSGQGIRKNFDRLCLVIFILVILIAQLGNHMLHIRLHHPFVSNLKLHPLVARLQLFQVTIGHEHGMVWVIGVSSCGQSSGNVELGCEKELKER